MQESIPIKNYPTIACCGLDCALCPTYYTKGPSKCPGCCGPNFADKHPSCSIITCCVKRNNFETCADCNEFPCSKLKDWDAVDSFICHRVSLKNLRFIKENGIETFMDQQHQRIKILKILLENFNEGRSKSFFCIATALLQVEDLEVSLKKANERIENENIESKNLKIKSIIIKEYLNDYATKQNVLLKLKRK
ncbi:MAG: DUF3795 domain-containing protein [Promethearchaeota archaeon]|jgi:hypothetical protein